MQYYDSSLPSYKDAQARLREEFETNCRCEWIEQLPDQPTGVFHGHHMNFYGIAKLICPQCGEVFYCKAESYHNGRKYCTCHCANAAYIARRAVWREEARDKICPICGKQFHAKRKDTVYCSLACKQRRYRQNKAQQEDNISE